MGDTHTRKLTRDWGREIKVGSGAFSIYRFNRGQPITRRHPGFIQYARTTTKFCTKSTYEGNYDSLGFAGYGEYIYPHGVKYAGNFKNGMFHGQGTLTYPLGQKIEGLWKKGKLMSHVYRCSDSLQLPRRYCQQPDRRFQLEKLTELRSPGEEFLTNKQPSKTLKEGCYDTVDGLFDPRTKCVYRDEHIFVRDKSRTYLCRQKPGVLRVCTQKEEQLVITNYRKAEDDPVGYRPDLYEEWTTGIKTEMEEIKNKLSSSLQLDGSPSSSVSLSESTTSDSENNIITV